MRIVCPCCQSDYPIEAGINDVDARNAIKRAFSLTPIGGQLLAYVQLFRPENRVMQMSKLTRLLDELITMVQAGQIKHNGTIYPAPQIYWENAIEQMLANRQQLKLPMKTHGYLISIIAGYAEKNEAKLEKQAETRRIGGVAHDAAPLQTKASAMPDEVRQQLQQFKSTKTTTDQSTTGEANGQNSHTT